ncbi:Response regulator receiver domain-containing protein [Nitrosomonas marina]|uniref:Response regulator receiver domain-containing protein n=1 Tax=Nitrosomonas marina TaxID=917 RepID=A0A1I0DYD9_9PROT|nr:response regulator [Nitrosomonas marina]SET37565.1 Response regulator receiver domain-containing protein [Nitrosomonas marina]
MRVECAADGGEALQAMERTMQNNLLFLLVIVDLHIPEMNGLQLAHAIQANSQYDRPSLLMLVSAGCQFDVAECRN